MTDLRILTTAGCMAFSALALAAVPGSEAIPFTEAQAIRGEVKYRQQCAACHGSTLQGGGAGPALTGVAFRSRWNAKSASLHVYIRDQMPLGSPGSLGDIGAAEVTAYILRQNRTTARPAELSGQGDPLAESNTRASVPMSRERTPLRALPTDPPDAVALATGAAETKLLAGLSSVTDAMLRNPPAGDWLHWRGTYGAEGFSRLDQINRSNVGKLRLAWAWQMGPGDNEVAPVVHDGVLFAASSGRVDALNAATGNLLWEYNNSSVTGVVRGLGIFDRLIIYPAETDIVALDASSGKVVWQRRFADAGSGIRFSAGPLIAKGKIFQGMGNCFSPYPGGCFLLAVDAKSGREAWRFHTLARPGEPGGDNWNDAPLDKRLGGSIWITGSYDADLDLIFFGAAQTYRTATLISDKKRAAGLYTDSTLALRPDTGKLIWHYQHLDGDVWDLDWAFERTLATLPINGRPRATVTTAGKMGIFDTLDAMTGEYLFSRDVGLQSLVTSIDRESGHKNVDPRLAPEAGIPKVLCPGSIGGRNWPSTAYNPASRVMFVPIAETCMAFTWNPGSNFDWSRVLKRRPGSDGMIGRIQAFDIATGDVKWTFRQRSHFVSALLATAGGVIFAGSHDRWFRALDDRTGKVLWEQRLQASPSGFPVTYSVNGVQYVAITVGGGGPADVIPGTLTPEIKSRSGSVTLMVFRVQE